MRPSQIKGFTVSNANAQWCVCNICEEDDLFYGARRDDDMLAWAIEHYNRNHRSEETTDHD